MPDNLNEFISQARQKGLSDNEIEQKLLAEGWPQAQVQAALSGSGGLVVPKPPGTIGNHPFDAASPIPVIHNLSTRGFEYSIMFASLWFSTLGIAGLLNSLVGEYLGEKSDYDFGGGLQVFWVTVLVVFAPIFAAMFLRLKKAEMENPSLLKDPSRKRLSHITQFATFIAGAIFLIYFVYSLMSGNIGTEYGMTMGELIAHLVVTLVVAGSVFFYYWREEHKNSSAVKPPQNAAL